MKNKNNFLPPKMEKENFCNLNNWTSSTAAAWIITRCLVPNKALMIPCVLTSPQRVILMYTPIWEPLGYIIPCFWEAPKYVFNKHTICQPSRDPARILLTDCSGSWAVELWNQPAAGDIS